MKWNTNTDRYEPTKEEQELIKKRVASLISSRKSNATSVTSDYIINNDTYGVVTPSVPISPKEKYHIFDNFMAQKKEEDDNKSPKITTPISPYKAILDKYELIFKNHTINILEINSSKDEITVNIDNKIYTKTLNNLKSLTLDTSDVIDFIAYVLLFSFCLPNNYWVVNNPILIDYNKKDKATVNEIEVVDMITVDMAACKHKTKPLFYNKDRFIEYGSNIVWYNNIKEYYPMISPNYHMLIYTIVKGLRHFTNAQIKNEYSVLIIKDIYDYYTKKRN
jgi:hypothetical protein